MISNQYCLCSVWKMVDADMLCVDMFDVYCDRDEKTNKIK